MKRESGRITSTELAALCNVSQGTVDRALNDRPGISPKAKKKILETAERLGYMKNLHASGLARGRSMLIGLVLFDLKNEFFAELATAVEEQAKADGYSVLLMLSGRDRDREADCIRRLCGMDADGIILCPVGFGEEYEQRLFSLRKSVVTVGNRLSDRFPHVGADDRQAMTDSVRYVLAHGYRRLIYIYTANLQQGVNNISAQRERYEGFAAAVRERGDVESVVLSDGDYVRTVQAMNFPGTCRTAVLCPSDYQALRIMNVLRNRGVSIPADVGIMGFDHIGMLQYVTPRLTTVDGSIAETGRACVRVLLHEIGVDVTGEDMPVRYTIVQGESL